MTRKEPYLKVYLTALPSIIRNFSEPHEGDNPRYIAEEATIVTSAVMKEIKNSIASAGVFFEAELPL